MREIIDDATARARRKNLHPAVPTSAHIAAWRAGGDLGGMGFRFPLLGDYVPDGWKEVKRHFVDMSGNGTSCEPAMTQSALARMMAHPSRAGHGWGLVEQYQFQGWVAEFEHE